MTPEDIVRLLSEADAMRKDIGLDGQADGLNLAVIRERPPSGYDKIRTPFGNCEILNCQPVHGGIQTVFYATRKQLLKYVEKANRAKEQGK